MAQHPYTLQSSNVVYQNASIKVREDNITRADGRPETLNVIETTNSVNVIAVNEKDEICLINIFRYLQNVWAWELPGGVSGEKGPINIAMRELALQTGLVANNYHQLGSLRLHGVVSGKIDLVVMRQLYQTGENKQKELGIEQTQFFSLEKIGAMLAAGEIDDAQTIAALSLYTAWRQQPSS